jgi:hypothetical protein
MFSKPLFYRFGIKAPEDCLDTLHAYLTNVAVTSRQITMDWILIRRDIFKQLISRLYQAPGSERDTLLMITCFNR